jgi:arsenical pump membrane protein
MNRLRRLHVLDWVALGLLVAGALCVASGLLPVEDADATIRRIMPLLLFLGSVIILAELTAAAEVFEVIAARGSRSWRATATSRSSCSACCWPPSRRSA